MSFPVRMIFSSLLFFICALLLSFAAFINCVDQNDNTFKSSVHRPIDYLQPLQKELIFSFLPNILRLWLCSWLSYANCHSTVDYIQATGISELRSANIAQDSTKSMAQIMKERMRPKSGKISIDYAVLQVLACFNLAVSFTSFGNIELKHA